MLSYRSQQWCVKYYRLRPHYDRWWSSSSLIVPRPTINHCHGTAEMRCRRGHTYGAKAVQSYHSSTRRLVSLAWFSNIPLGFLDNGRIMAPPHTRFKPSFHNHLSHLSRHVFNRDESQHSSIKTVIPKHEDDPDSLDLPRNISVDGPNQGLKPPEEPEIDRICTLSENHLSEEPACLAISSFEAGNFAVGLPRQVKEVHVARQTVIFSTSFVIYGTIDSITSNSDTTTLSTSPSSTSPSYTPTTSSTSFRLSTTTPLQSSPQQLSATPSSYTVYTILSSPGDNPIVAPTSGTPTTTVTTTSLQPDLASPTISSNGTVIVSSPLAQPTSVPATNSDPRSPHTPAIVGGVIGAIALLVLLFFIVVWYRRKRQQSVTPFTLPSTVATSQINPAAWIKFQSMGDATRPSSGVPLSPQYSDACLVEHPGNRCPSFVTDPVSCHLPNDDDVFASIRITQHQQANVREKLYPYPSRARTSGHYCRSSIQNWIEQVVMEEDGSLEPSEALPEYRSTKSLRSGEVDNN
ncbi:hypothetical protein DEU56DRAFT_793881, partial [Suillus clintonianus]|uniref:uncharacterized protein n=1 Tax=Suillus clintonianus TaxID=1904413 RepID=UPI001B8860D7